VHEANPLLRPFERHLVWLEAVNTGAVVAEISFVKQLSRRHPRAATAVAAALTVAKAWAVVQNVRVAGRIQAAGRR
jgi:3-deoxy-D-manno-octulosonic-acid transferase